MKVLITPLLAAVVFAAACDGDPTAVGPKASVRFFNATEMTGRGGFTADGQFAAGSALALGQSTQTCSTVDAGATSFGFGAANAGGTALSGNVLATTNGLSIADGGNFTVAATGSATNPMLFLLDNSFSGSLASNQAAFRFVNLAPGTSTAANTYVVYLGAFGSGQTVGVNLAVGAPTAFITVPSGTSTFSVLKLPGHVVVTDGGAFTLQAGTVNTIAIVPNTSGGFQLINIPRCS